MLNDLKSLNFDCFEGFKGCTIKGNKNEAVKKILLFRVQI